MKSIGKLKLNQLSRTELERRELNDLRGGNRCCLCGCDGSSTTADNYSANIDGGANGYYSPGYEGGLAYGSFSGENF
jgi:natural product precursor